MAELPLVARRIQEIRLSKKLSRRQLAERLSTTYLQVYRIETGVTEASAETAAEFAQALDVSVAALFRESKAAS